MARTRDDYRSVNGLQKAALLMMSVGENTAAKLFQIMHDDEIREISQTMANLGTVNATIVERLFVEFADSVSSTGSVIGSFDTTEHSCSRSWTRTRSIRSWRISVVLPAGPCGTSWAT